MKFLRLLIGFLFLIYLAYAYLSNTLQYSFYAVIANTFFEIGSFIGNLVHLPPVIPHSEYLELVYAAVALIALGLMLDGFFGGDKK
ncbi:MAG: hypothetical protein M1431_04280 [Candidatus Thermoplasmatota archaeon]|nr:hypothetical protein [Candidatus Thermoplasmatota archaeon]